MPRDVGNIIKAVKGHVELLGEEGVEYIPVKRKTKAMTDPPDGAKNKALTTREKLIALKKITDVCTKCPALVQNRTHVVFGSGYAKADLMFVGEAPGSEEDRQGLPFVGRAGQLLTKMIESHA